MCQIKWERLAVLRKDVKLSATDFVVDLSLSFRSIVYTVGPLVATMHLSPATSFPKYQKFPGQIAIFGTS